MGQTRVFTLVELLVVIAIIAVLLAILLPSMSSVKEAAKRLKCGNGERSIGSSIKFYADDFDGRLPLLEEEVRNPAKPAPRNGHTYWAFCITSNVVGMCAMNMGCLSRAGIVENPIIFYCQADDAWRDRWKCYNTPGPWGKAMPNWTFPDPYCPQQSDTPAVRVGYAYWPQSMKVMKTEADVKKNQDGLAGQCAIGGSLFATKIADLSGSKAMLADNGGHALGDSLKDAGTDTTNKGHNALFGDGHVVFQKPPTVQVPGPYYGQYMSIRQEAGVINNTVRPIRLALDFSSCICSPDGRSVLYSGIPSPRSSIRRGLFSARNNNLGSGSAENWPTTRCRHIAARTFGTYLLQNVLALFSTVFYNELVNSTQ
jgi:prepilin-type N-terminal cleavage/methylation domain-containing protein/prepilin-type processing-associated H-X9-DG protein